MQPHPLQLPHYMLTFQGHEASQIYLFNSAVLVVALWLSRVLDLSCSKRWSTGGVASSRTRPLTPLVGKFSKSKVGPKKKIREERGCGFVLRKFQQARTARANQKKYLVSGIPTVSLNCRSVGRCTMTRPRPSFLRRHTVYV